MYKTLHKKQGSVTVQLRFARSSVTFCAKRDTAQKVSGLLKKYEIKKCLLVTGHHVVRHSITQNVIKALSVEGIHCDVCLRLQQYVVE